MNTKQIIEKWYKTLRFPARYDAEFYEALDKTEIGSPAIESYDVEDKDGRRNFLSFLYMCERLSERYKEKGVGDEILLDTLGDIGRWLDVWSGLEGGLYLGELHWLRLHMGMGLFKLGRLQFAFGKSHCDIPEKNIKKGDNVIEVHIPRTGPLEREECERSFEIAKEFFAKYYPEYEYKYFTCHSWLMDESLKALLPPESNIIKFQDMFEVFCAEESYAALRFIFKWNAKKAEIGSFDAKTSLEKNIKAWVLDGKKLYQALGVIEKS